MNIKKSTSYATIIGGTIDNTTIGATTPAPGTFTTLGLKNATELTVASGSITVTQSYHTVDTESDAASDDLTAIVGGTAGQFLVLQAANDARTVNVIDGGTLYLQGDFALDSNKDVLVLVCTAANTWVEVNRASNA